MSTLLLHPINSKEAQKRYLRGMAKTLRMRSQVAAMNSCFVLVRSHQHGIANTPEGNPCRCGIANTPEGNPCVAQPILQRGALVWHSQYSRGEPLCGIANTPWGNPGGNCH